jgi:hypothetical protein
VKLDKAIEDVQDAEADVARHLRVVGERHATEHDLHHLGHTLAQQCEEQLVKLAPFADRYGASAGDRGVAESPGVLESLRHKSAELMGRAEAAGLVLLHDLRTLYLAAQEAEIAWVILGQAAKAARDPELIEVVEQCHEKAELRAMWVRTRIKVTAPEILVSG